MLSHPESTGNGSGERTVFVTGTCSEECAVKTYFNKAS